MLTQTQTTYAVKQSSALSDTEIRIILDSWDVPDWKEMKADEFRQRFDKSEFHLLSGPDQKLLSVARINFKFKVKIGEVVYPIAELVGFVAIEILKGYGKILLGHIKESLLSRKIEAVGFCKNKSSTYYESCGFRIFYNTVKYLRERKNDQWFTPTEDDDIISLTLDKPAIALFEKLSDEHPAYLLFE